jgi:hypothetical protein
MVALLKKFEMMTILVLFSSASCYAYESIDCSGVLLITPKGR